MPTLIIALSILLLLAFIAYRFKANRSTEQDDVLVMSYAGDLWIATEDEYQHPVTLANCGIGVNGEPFASPLILSPQHDSLAYITQLDYAAYNHLRLCDGTSLTESTLNPAAEYIYSWPSWSPDGSHLAYLRYDSQSRTSSLCIVELASQQMTPLVPQMPSPCNLTGHLVLWGQGAILVYRQQHPTASEFLLYTLEGQLNLAFACPYPALEDFFWVKNGQNDDLLVISTQGEASLLNLHTATWQAFNGAIESIPTRKNSLTLRYHPHRNQWQIITPQQTAHVLEFPLTRHHIALSPSGQMLAYATDRIYLWHHGQIHPVGLDYQTHPDPRMSLAWTPIQWRTL